MAFQVATDASGVTLKMFLAGKLDAPKAVSLAKATYASVGRLYGTLSNSAVHASAEHIFHSISSDPSALDGGLRIRIGASFDPASGRRFKLGLIRIERVTIAITALVGAIFLDRLEAPQFWKRVPAGIQWSGNPAIDLRLRQADEAQEAIEHPFLTVYSWADPRDRLEVEQFLGTTRGPALADKDRLTELSQAHPKSFILRYLLGSALEGKGDLTHAATEFEAAWELRPDAYDVREHLEGIYATGKDFKPLESFYKRLLKRNPDDYIAAHNLGMLYTRTGQHEAALTKCFQEAHSIKPERYLAPYNAARTLVALAGY